MIEIVNKWCEESTKLKLKNIKQILFYDGRYAYENIVDKNIVDNYAYVEIQIDTSTEMGSNTLNVNTIYEYFKNLMYVDKKEWDDFFVCMISQELDHYCLVCERC